MEVTHEDMLHELKDHISKEFQKHVKDYHDDAAMRDFGIGEPISVRQLVAEHFVMLSDLEEIAAALLGKKQSNLMGGGRDQTGMIQLVRDNAIQLKTLSQAGIVNLRLPVPIWVAIITTIGLLLAAVIGLFS
jgi:hypothetical protein